MAPVESWRGFRRRPRVGHAREPRFVSNGGSGAKHFFDGLSAGDLHEIVFVEVKTGPAAALSPRERKVRDAVLEGRVRWKEFRVAGPDAR